MRRDEERSKTDISRDKGEGGGEDGDGGDKYFLR